MRTRGYIILEFFCQNCGCNRPFTHIYRWASPQRKSVRRRNGRTEIFPSANPIPNIPENARLIRGTCMVCDRPAQYVTTQEIWEAGHFSTDSLCDCGLPYDHDGKHLEELRVAS